jgi:thiol-disulfide isomerase/thioredoxin
LSLTELSVKLCSSVQGSLWIIARRVDFSKILKEVAVAFRIQPLSIISCIAWSAALSLTGCGPEKKDEVSAATSGYMPADAKKDSSEKSGKSLTSSAEAGNLAASSGLGLPSGNPPANANPAVAQSSSGGLPQAPNLPEFEPGKIDPAIAGREFMKLAIPDSKEPDVLAAYLAKNGRALRELFAEGSKKTLTRETVLKRGMELCRDKVAVAEKLMTAATDNKQKSMGIISKMEALTQMAGMGDVISADDLRDFVSKQISSDIPEIAEQSTAIWLALAVNDLESGSVKPEGLMETIEKTLQSKTLGPAILSSVAGAIEAVEKSTKTPQIELAKKVEAAFRDSKDPNASMMAWQVLAQRTKSMADLQEALGKENDAIEAAAKAVLEDLPSPWTAFFLASSSTNIEYSGRVEAAKILVKLAEEKIDSLPSEELKSELKSNCEKFWKRVSIVGSELDFSELAELDGKPFSIESYKGKVVVLDFWATWCGPCLEEIPNLKSMLEKRQSEGVEIIGINLDEDRNRLDSFLGTEKLPWKTIVSSDATKVAFETPLVSKIGISAIPFIAILGKDGKVAAIHIRGKNLDPKVAELLGIAKE